MSFSATVDAMRSGAKTVTRRDPDTWTMLQPGDRLVAVEKAMGLRAGEHQVPIGVIEIVSNRVEMLRLVCEPGEYQREGFDSYAKFWRAWVHHLGKPADGETLVRRIEFRHVAEWAS